jgi:hypothetical protein
MYDVSEFGYVDPPPTCLEITLISVADAADCASAYAAVSLG